MKVLRMDTIIFILKITEISSSCQIGSLSFLQVRFNFCLDITYLEVFREILFLVIFGYAQLVSLRIALSWFISINPYTVPWIYLWP